MTREFDVRTAIGLAAEFIRREVAVSEDLRNLLLRSHMDTRRLYLVTLRGASATYLASSLALMACVPVFGWWIALACPPLSLMGAADGRAWRDLRYRWEPPIVLPSPTPLGPLLSERGE